MKFKDNLRDLRIGENLTIQQLANILNVSPGSIGDWEHGRCEPDLEKIIEIANYFHITLDSLIEPNINSDEIGKSRSRFLSEEECLLIDNFRAMNKTDKNFYLEIAKAKSRLKKDE